jgi:hypothetical protein
LTASRRLASTRKLCVSSRRFRPYVVRDHSGADDLAE